MGSAESLEKLEPGDLVEIDRGAYNHWAVYIGRGYVVHLTDNGAPGFSSNHMSAQNKKAIVRKDKLQDVVGTDKWQINNILDKKYKPRPVEEIIKKAVMMVGQKFSYSVFTNNCEHFATALRYGKAESRQVKIAEEGALGAGVVAVVAGIAAVAVSLVASGTRR